MGFVAPRHVGSSQARALTRVPCIGRWILNHCATRKVPGASFGRPCFHCHLPLSAARLVCPAWGHLLVSPFLPVKQNCCVTNKNPFVQHLLHEPSFPCLGPYPFFPLTPHPSHPQSGSFSSKGWKLLASGIPRTRRGKRQKPRDPEPSAANDVGWMMDVYVPVNHNVYNDLIYFILFICGCIGSSLLRVGFL